MKFSYSFVQVVTLLLSLSPSVEGFTRSRNDACKPNHPFRPLPPSQPRTKTCHVVSNGHGKDDSKNIMKALHKCNNGGKVVFDANKVYTVGTALDMTFLKHIDLGRDPYHRCRIDHCLHCIKQRFWERSSLPMIPITGKPTPSSTASRMPRPSSSWW